MKYLTEYRDPEAATRYLQLIKGLVTKPVSIMEICGGQTHAIVKHGLDQLLPDDLTLIHGPGCPVCVTPVELIDQAVSIAAREQVIFCSFGDMLRVPGSKQDLLSVKARGGDVRVVYSPLDAVTLAKENPDKEVVFFAVGFETTAPANAMSVYQAHRANIPNFSILSAHVLVPPAMEVILSSPDNRVQGFLAAGHVCAVVGYEEYVPIAEKYRVPIVVTGFEPLDILQGIAMTLRQLRDNRAQVENQYARIVKKEGNATARRIVNQVFEVTDRKWRGLGVIPNSGLALTEEYRAYNAETRFPGVAGIQAEEDPDCISGLILQGIKKPHECPAFGVRCTPEHPLGAPMVSSEGACAAYYRYRRHQPH
jgi:hydrogenase expression/formation protein HypD